ncbi:uncharacterized protein CELE_Y97E10C.1 [Caenorhabditis elegans]|uniref:Uncharacterized protein n=1 Tax=Caenorhabditis elegans TaxID=6239 RepID=Q8MXT9_CAEEL|nr:Uncharacterized protein CELE_Y97E10C.1 [Caenorhabditis elegans]CCD74334.1 Uncharacterized protein CELE_Y97E10C.1 [Caenorhabditis elegans]|eukprot:NP_741565.2 Uncharacterized protein CELE_Y97E10C.1 [Caenorhabditis elegans]
MMSSIFMNSAYRLHDIQEYHLNEESTTSIFFDIYPGRIADAHHPSSRSSSIKLPM